jgi:catechol 2,3-dioxygenase-like lactoylglutathione lyase family enzyme
MSAATILGTDFVFRTTQDFARARAFYEDTLGLEFSVDYRRIPGGEFETGSLTLQIIEAGAIGLEFTPAGGAIALRVADVAAARAELEARGVAFRGDTIDSGVCHQAHFADPDGNALILHHRYAPPG